VATYRTGDFRKGLKVQIDGEPYLMSEMNFRKPGKGNAIYECTLKNLIRGTTLKRVFRGGDELESADVEEVACQFLYRQGDTFVFMHVELKVEYCEPGARGDTATNVTKPVKVETGAEILAPLFIQMGNVIKIDTRTGEYIERVST
jgi:elongation factor P